VVLPCFPEFLGDEDAAVLSPKQEVPLTFFLPEKISPSFLVLILPVLAYVRRLPVPRYLLF